MTKAELLAENRRLRKENEALRAEIRLHALNRIEDVLE